MQMKTALRQQTAEFFSFFSLSTTRHPTGQPRLAMEPSWDTIRSSLVESLSQMSGLLVEVGVCDRVDVVVENLEVEEPEEKTSIRIRLPYNERAFDTSTIIRCAAQ